MHVHRQPQLGAVLALLAVIVGTLQAADGDSAFYRIRAADGPPEITRFTPTGEIGWTNAMEPSSVEMSYALSSNVWAPVAGSVVTPSGAVAHVHFYGAPPCDKGDRRFGLTVTPAQSNTYSVDFSIAKTTGIDCVSFALEWDLYEPSPGTFVDSGGYLQAANIFYPAMNTGVILYFNVLDTIVKRVPTDLMTTPFDAPVMLARFTNFVHFVRTNLTDLVPVSIGIGNEVDGYLGADSVAWAEYRTFCDQATAYVRGEWPGVPVGTRVMFAGFMDTNRTSLVRDLTATSDVYMVTYYPINSDFTVRDPAVVKHDFLGFVARWPDKPIQFVEVGYPTSAVLGSSPERQVEFVREIFRAWDVHASHVKVVHFLWLTDLGPDTMASLTNYYGLGDTNFCEYLRTLGYRTWDGAGTHKPGFNELGIQAYQRGWRGW